MRILYLNATGQLGGAETSLLEMLASLRSAAPDCELNLIAAGHGPLVARVRELNVPAEVLPFPDRIAALGDGAAAAGHDGGDRRAPVPLLLRMAAGGADGARYAYQLRRAMARIAPDVIHTNGCKMHALGLWCRTGPARVVWHIHDYIQPRPVMRRLLAGCAHDCAAAIVNSHSVAADLSAACRGRLTSRCIYNAVDLRRFSPSGPVYDLDASAGLAAAPAGSVRVGLLATFARWKGHEVFLRALSLLPETLPWRASIIGGPVYQTAGSQYGMQELQDLARRFGLENRVGFTGFLSDPAPALRALDIVVHCSTQPEPFGLAIAEAMACGKAVLVSAAGGAAELFRHGHDALGYPPGDAVALARAIHQLVCEPHLRQHLGYAARVSAEQRFDRSRLAGELLSIYESVTGKN